jgi:thiamine pyrophosphokinase
MTKEELNLPQVQVNFHRPLPEACRLLVLGGRTPATNWLQALLEQSPAPKLWAIDHGIDACRSASALRVVRLGVAYRAAP